LGAVIALTNELLLHEPARKPTPTLFAAIKLPQSLSQAADVCSLTGIDHFQLFLGTICPILGLHISQATITAAARRRELTHREQQSLLSANLSLSNRLHPPQLLLRKLHAPNVVVGGLGFSSTSQSGLHRPAQAGSISRRKQNKAMGRSAIASSST
jgi:hypothetical protein